MSDSLDLLSLVFIVEWEDGHAEDFQSTSGLIVLRCVSTWGPRSPGEM